MSEKLINFQTYGIISPRKNDRHSIKKKPFDSDLADSSIDPIKPPKKKVIN